MEPDYSTFTHTRAGTLGGFFLALFLQIHPGDIARTATLAVIGGVVSFLVSMGMKLLVRWIKKHSR